MIKELIPIKGLISEYHESHNFVRCKIGNKDCWISLLFTHDFSGKNNTNFDMQIDAHFRMSKQKSLEVTEAVWNEDILEQVVKSVVKREIYIQSAKKSDMFTSGIRNFILGIIFLPLMLFGRINDKLYIIGVNCTQEEVDKMDGLIRLDFEKN